MKIMKRISLIICLGILFSIGAFSAMAPAKFHIKGTIDKSFDGQLAILSLKIDGQTAIPTDTAVISQGQFSFEGNAYPVYLSSLAIEDKYGTRTCPELELVLEPGILSVSLSKDQSFVEGTPLNGIYREYQDSMKYFKTQIAQIEPQWENEVVIFPGTELERLYYTQGEYMINFAKRNYTNPLGKALFMRNLEIALIPMGLYISMSKKTVDELFAFVDDETRTHPRFITYKKVMEKARAASSLSGKKIGNFSFSTPSGKSKPIKAFIGKKEYVFLEFWVSWCGSCLSSIPKLKEIYAAHADKLEIVSISLDTDPASWRDALKAQKMPWPQLSASGGFDSDIAKAFGVKNIPFGLLVDKQGLVIAKISTTVVLESFFEQLTPKH